MNIVQRIYSVLTGDILKLKEPDEAAPPGMSRLWKVLLHEGDKLRVHNLYDKEAWAWIDIDKFEKKPLASGTRITAVKALWEELMIFDFEAEGNQHTAYVSKRWDSGIRIKVRGKRDAWSREVSCTIKDLGFYQIQKQILAMYDWESDLSSTRAVGE